MRLTGVSFGQLRLPGAALLLLLLLPIGGWSKSTGGRCHYDDCLSSFSARMSDLGITVPEHSPEYCKVLRAAKLCMDHTGACPRGDLNYESARSLLHKLSMLYCAKGAKTPPPEVRSVAPPVEEPETEKPVPEIIPVVEVTTTSQPPTPYHVSEQCQYQNRNGNRWPGPFRHCGLYGDPHLKTWSGQYQTCRLKGAWPLVNLPYLAVQVTNELVHPKASATAATKVTVVIRGSRRCPANKTYEASSGSEPLPAAFIDGTDRSGSDGGVRLQSLGPDNVEIHISHIGATLIIRKSGDFLGISVQLPEAELLSPSGGGLQLCEQGCPAEERLDPVASRGEAVPWDSAMARCGASPGLTEPYLGWCIFDVMTAGGDVGVLEAAARSAQIDATRLDPNTLVGGRRSGSCSSTPLSRHLPLLSSLLVLLLILLR